MRSSLFTKENLKKISLATFLEFAPTVLFLIAFQTLHIYKATFILMLATIITTVITYKIQKRLPYLALYIAFITIIFGFMTIHFHKPRFIQIRDTLYDLTFAFTLIVGQIFGKSLYKISFEKLINLTDRSWDRITYSWVVFLLLLALTNEFVRRNFSLDLWFDYKLLALFAMIVFGAISTIVFYEEKK